MALRIGMLTSPRMRPSLGTSESSLSSTCFTPGSASTASRASLSIWLRSGQAGVVSMTVNETLLPWISRFADHVQGDQVLVQFRFLYLS